MMMGVLTDSYTVKPIDNKLAQQTHIISHYLHRKASCSYAFGLFDGLDVLRGVITYGSPASPNVTKGVCGPEEALNVIELTRLWIDDETPKNSESFLISHSLPLVPKDIIISYAEPQQKHLGIVYQATNWLYTGLSAKRTNWEFGDKANKHNRSFSAKYSSAELKTMFGDDFKLVDRPRKHRYVYFNCNSKKRKKELFAKLRYKLEPYPKFWQIQNDVIFSEDFDMKKFNEEYPKIVEDLRLFLGDIYVDLADGKPISLDKYGENCKNYLEQLKQFYQKNKAGEVSRDETPASKLEG